MQTENIVVIDDTGESGENDKPEVQIEIPAGPGCQHCFAAKVHGWHYHTFEQLCSMCDSSEQMVNCVIAARSFLIGDTVATWGQDTAHFQTSFDCEVDIEFGGWLESDLPSKMYSGK